MDDGRECAVDGVEIEHGYNSVKSDRWMNGLNFVSNFVDSLVVRDSVEVRKWGHIYEIDDFLASIDEMVGCA